MYCYTMLTDTMCVIRELDMWTEISKEHPIFLKNVAKLSNINLPNDLVASLDKVNEQFESLHRTVKQLMAQQPYGGMGWMPNPQMMQVRALVETFLQYDMNFINVLRQVQNHGKENAVWQTLVGHITQEQEYMYRLFTGLRNQMYGMR
ncbi:MAG: DUF2935 domain-containing protein [Clostridia bacterium]